MSETLSGRPLRPFPGTSLAALGIDEQRFREPLPGTFGSEAERAWAAAFVERVLARYHPADRAGTLGATLCIYDLMSRVGSHPTPDMHAGVPLGYGAEHLPSGLTRADVPSVGTSRLAWNVEAARQGVKPVDYVFGALQADGTRTGGMYVEVEPGRVRCTSLGAWRAALCTPTAELANYLLAAIGVAGFTGGLLSLAEANMRELGSDDPGVVYVPEANDFVLLTPTFGMAVERADRPGMPVSPVAVQHAAQAASQAGYPGLVTRRLPWPDWASGPYAYLGGAALAHGTRAYGTRGGDDTWLRASPPRPTTGVALSHAARSRSRATGATGFVWAADSDAARARGGALVVEGTATPGGVAPPAFPHVGVWVSEEASAAGAGTRVYRASLPCASPPGSTLQVLEPGDVWRPGATLVLGYGQTGGLRAVDALGKLLGQEIVTNV